MEWNLESQRPELTVVHISWQTIEPGGLRPKASNIEQTVIRIYWMQLLHSHTSPSAMGTLVGGIARSWGHIYWSRKLPASGISYIPTSQHARCIFDVVDARENLNARSCTWHFSRRRRRKIKIHYCIKTSFVGRFVYFLFLLHSLVFGCYHGSSIPSFSRKCPRQD